jgi:integrase
MVTRPGRKGYYADFRVGGNRVQKKLGTDFEAAKSILIELRARAERGEWGLLDNDYPVDDLKASYLKRCKQELKELSGVRYQAALNAILTWLGVRKVSQLDTARVLAYREAKLAKLSPRTVNYHVNALATMLRWGADQKIIGSNPLDGIQPLPLGQLKEGRPLSNEEVQRLLDKSSQPWRDIWYALLATGMRRMELALLTFADVDWEGRELIVRSHRAKNHRERRIPIEDGLFAILKKQQEEAPFRQPGTGKTAAQTARLHERFTKEHVFTTSQNTPLTHKNGMWNAFIRCCKRAGIQYQTFDAEGRLVEHVDVHSLRRTFATDLIEQGVNPKTVQELLGHRTLEMTMKIYNKVRQHGKRQAVGRLSYSAGATAPNHLLPMPEAAG